MQPLQLSAEHWQALQPPQRAALTKRTDWLAKARPKQLPPPGDWLTWLILAGRGFGKTRTGAEDLWWYGAENPGVRLAIVAPTWSDARDTCFEGDSGILNVAPRECVQTYNRSLGEMVLWNGSRIKAFSADEPERLRGPQFHRAWCDELAAWRYPEAWDQLLFGLRLGQHPQAVVTTTPKPTDMVKRLAAAPTTRITRGSTFENAGNLAPSALQMLKARYEGTRLGRQELNAEILGDMPGALWTMAVLDSYRLQRQPDALGRIVVAVDPAVTAEETSDEHGIIVAGMDGDGGVVLEDASLRGSPHEWARRAVSLYRSYAADGIVVEVNQGGDMVAHTIRTVDPNVNIIEVRASRGKHVRAEPIAALYEQGRIRHVGAFPELESQMTQMTSAGFQGTGSPDRVDALVWALTELFPDITEGRPQLPEVKVPKIPRGMWMT